MTTSGKTQQITIGVFGGSGFYSIEGVVDEIAVDTPYGPPSDKISLVEIGGRRVAFLPRHGRTHAFMPHKINYRANLWAMRSLGVTDIIAPTAAGSLQAEIRPGSFVICDQFVDRTSGREDTFFHGPITTHVSAADPYCPILRDHAVQVCRDQRIDVHPTGTVVVIQGPRFSTKAESRWFHAMGWHVINMTQYPECHLARELEISYVNVSLITDYDAGLFGSESGLTPSTTEEIMHVFRANNDKLRSVLSAMIATLPDTSASPARNHLASARMG